VKGKVGKGLYNPVSGSGSETTLGVMKLWRKLLCDLCRALCVLYATLGLQRQPAESRAVTYSTLTREFRAVKDDRAPAEKDELTQFLLKQSCEQKKLSLMPSLRQVGHCRVPASLPQSSPMHLRVATVADPMAGVMW
jgi:hypothetical protein